MTGTRNRKHKQPPPPTRASRRVPPAFFLAALIIVVAIVLLLSNRSDQPSAPERLEKASAVSQNSSALTTWRERAFAVTSLFHIVYTPCWEGAYGAIGDAYLFAATHDSSLYRFHLVDHDLRLMCEGTWVDDRAWVCLAELQWWEVTGRTNMSLVLDARRRYLDARDEGRFSRSQGFWTWYNWPPEKAGAQAFTNSNMNQMVTVACGLYAATGEASFKSDALLAWNGDGTTPGIEATWYRGGGVWIGKGGRAAFGNQLPWRGVGYCSVASALYRMTGEKHYKDIAVATAKYALDPRTGWVDPTDYYQLRMDGNGAFVNFLLDAYAVAPEELADVPGKIEKMLTHVWTNAHSTAVVQLHRMSDNGIRNGWNPRGGEDGYGVNEVGTVHAQGEAARAFGVFTYYEERAAATKPVSQADQGSSP